MATKTFRRISRQPAAFPDRKHHGKLADDV